MASSYQTPKSDKVPRLNFQNQTVRFIHDLPNRINTSPASDPNFRDLVHSYLSLFTSKPDIFFIEDAPIPPGSEIDTPPTDTPNVAKTPPYTPTVAVSNGRSVTFISDLINERGLLANVPTEKHTPIHEVDVLHEVADILFIDHFSKWTEPPEAVSSLIDRCGYDPHLASAEFVGFKYFLCSATKHEVAIPILKEHGCLSPVHGWNSIKSSVSRLVRSLVSLYDTGKCDYLMCMDLTYPKEFSNLLLSDFNGTLEKSKRCLKLFIEKVESAFYEGAKLCVHENTHAWASETPFEPHLHHHANFPNCIRTDHGLVRVRPGFFKGKEPDPEKLDLLRKLWKEAIIETFGRVIPIDNWTSNLFPQYISLKQRVRLVHRLKYCARRAMSDFFEWYFTDCCPSERLSFVSHLFGYKNPRHHFGWSIGTMVNVQSAPKHVCPICHAPAELLGKADTVKPDFHIVIWDHGLWNWIPPPGYGGVVA